MIKTKLLTSAEVLELLRHYDGQCLDHRVRDYFKVYNPTGKDLEKFLDEVAEIDPKLAGEIYEYALSVPNHNLSNDYIMGLVNKGHIKISKSSKAASFC
jgi:hypothetical protein